MTYTVLSLEQATNNLPSDESFMSFGLEPTGMVLVTRFVAVSITLIEALAQLETKRVDPSLEKTSSYGFTSTGMRVTIFLVLVSKTTMLLGRASVPRLAA